MYKIVIDSCGELPENLKNDEHFTNVALELDVDGYRIRDDETFNQLDFLRRVKESIKGPKSACPSPEEYMEAFEGEAENIYVVTLSGKLSGSYNSAVLASNLYNEEHEDSRKNDRTDCSDTTYKSRYQSTEEGILNQWKCNGSEDFTTAGSKVICRFFYGFINLSQCRNTTSGSYRKTSDNKYDNQNRSRTVNAF